MSKDDRKAIADRRGFLKLATLGAVSAGATLAATGEADAAASEPRPGETYRETAHIRRYYELARG